MKKTGLLSILLAGVTWAQTATNAIAPPTPPGTVLTSETFPVQRIVMPTYADLYCAGFLSRQSLPDSNYVAGGLQTPTDTKFVRNDVIGLPHGSTGSALALRFSRLVRRSLALRPTSSRNR